MLTTLTKTFFFIILGAVVDSDCLCALLWAILLLSDSFFSGSDTLVLLMIFIYSFLLWTILSIYRCLRKKVDKIKKIYNSFSILNVLKQFQSNIYLAVRLETYFFKVFYLVLKKLSMSLDPFSTDFVPLSTFPGLNVGTINLLPQDQLLGHLIHYPRTNCWDT